MTDWPHAPVHRFDAGIYFVTAGTYLRQPFYTGRAARDFLQQLLFTKAKEHECELQAWCLLTNHYHLVVSTDDGGRLKALLEKLHSEASRAANEWDGTRGRKVWFQFRETQLTYEKSWLARLRYTHENAVHHGLVDDARKYSWCSASWFERTAPRAFVETVRRMKIDRVKVYEP